MPFLDDFEKVALSKKLLSRAAQKVSERIRSIGVDQPQFKELAKRFDRFDSKARSKVAGALHSRLMAAHKGRTIAGAALGAAAGAGGGATADKEHRSRGAIAGGVLGGMAGAAGVHAARSHATHQAINKHQSALMDRMGGLMSRYRAAEKGVGSNVGSNKAKHRARDLLRQQFRVQSAGKHQVALTQKEPPKELAEKLKRITSPAERKKLTSDWMHGKLQERFPDWKGPGKWRS